MTTKNSTKGLAILLILPAVVMLASGCTNLGLGGSSTSGYGIVIKTFESSLSSIESEDDLVVHLEVQNMGDVIGEAAAQLIGIYPPEWGQPNTEFYIGELLPADENRGTTGQLGIADWYLKAPSLMRGEKRTYNPIARVFYTYETRVIKPITFLTSEETKRAVQNGESLPSEMATVSSGPLSVTVNTGEFVRTKDDIGWDQSYFPVEIKITNVGGGLLAGENYPLGIEIFSPPGTIFRGDCPRSSQADWVAFDTSILPAGLIRHPATNIVHIWNGKDTTITCELKVIDPPEYRETRDLIVTLNYVYYQDETLPINVIGTREWGF